MFKKIRIRPGWKYAEGSFSHLWHPSSSMSIFSARTHSIDHSSRGLHPWPKAREPTPYEIFAIDDTGMSTIELNKALKATYLKYVKMYHPDLNHQVLDKGQELTPEIKRKRFDQVQNAYDILKDPRRRVAFKRYTTTQWNPNERFSDDIRQPFSRANFEAFRKAHGNRGAYSFKRDETFWKAGTWEDYYQMKYKRAPPTREEINKNKYKILFGVLTVGALAFGLQFMLALDAMNEYQHQTRIMNMKAMRDISNAEEANKLQRLERFLSTRRSTLAVKEGLDSPQDVDRNPEDRQLLQVYAQKQVAKWDE